MSDTRTQGSVACDVREYHTAMVQGSHGMVAQARRHLDPCVSVLREHVLRTRVEHMRTARHRGESIERRECWLA